MKTPLSVSSSNLHIILLQSVVTVILYPLVFVLWNEWNSLWIQLSLNRESWQKAPFPTEQALEKFISRTGRKADKLGQLWRRQMIWLYKRDEIIIIFLNQLASYLKVIFSYLTVTNSRKLKGNHRRSHYKNSMDKMTGKVISRDNRYVNHCKQKPDFTCF